MRSEDLAEAEGDARAAKYRAERERRRALFAKEVSDWTLDELCEQLFDRYKETAVPPCRLCGRALSLQAFGNGPSVWACTGQEDDPEDSERLRYLPGRKLADEHYSKSRFEDHRQGGDQLVVELIYRALGGQDRLKFFDRFRRKP